MAYVRVSRVSGRRVRGMLELTRGLNPGESFELTNSAFRDTETWYGNQYVTVDPANRIPEANEQNNSVTLESLAELNGFCFGP